MEYKGLVLDKFQEESIEALNAGNSVIVSAPTGSGKTLIADYVIEKALKKGKKVIYTAPIKALSNQKFKEFSNEFGADNVGLLTGDIVKNPGAPIKIMTTEIYRNMCIQKDEVVKEMAYVIFDEIHFLNDIERGYVWEESIIFSSKNIRMLCLSATIPNADELGEWINSIKKHEVVVISHHKRPVPLERKFYSRSTSIAGLEDLKYLMKLPRRGKRHRMKGPDHSELIREIRDKLPCIFFTFSRANTQKNAIDLAKKRIFKLNTKIITHIRQKLRDAPSEINQLKSVHDMRQVLPYGIAFHHAGLIPVMKELVEELFAEGLIKVLYATETFAVGINMPAKSVCFESLRKFDGVSFRFLTSKEYFQMAGRAGRRGIDTKGFAYVMVDERDFDYTKIKKTTDKDTEKIQSKFKLSVNTVLNLIHRHSPEDAKIILAENLYTFQRKGTTIEAVFENTKKKLEKLGYTKGWSLTEKGKFSSKIYSDEILCGETFATDFYHGLSDYQILLLIATMAYEARESTRIYKLKPDGESRELTKKIKKHEVLAKEQRLKMIKVITGLAKPIYNGADIFDVLENTNLLEGDIIRFIRQILDRIGQIKQATNDMRLVAVLDHLQEKLFGCINAVDDI